MTTPDSALKTIPSRIQTIRGLRVMLDADLAQLYGVKTERLNQQVRRNADRFPADFMFRLTAEERRSAMCLQIASTLRRTRRSDYAPLAFTEHGCLMLANVLRSPRAVQVSVLIVRAFVQLRSAIAANQQLAARIDALSATVTSQGRRLATHEKAILKLLADIRRLTAFPETPSRPIGFTADLGDGGPAPPTGPREAGDLD
ncbi:MAG: ORF6N domain-containing protein [Steroidobacteraceae bacterium]